MAPEAIATSGERRPWLLASSLLIGLGALFYTSYGFSNWLAGTRAHVPSIVFNWERSVPFLAWTIVPYWTTNVFYAGSLFLCADRIELGAHARRLLTTQIVAIACFIAAPLKFSWPKPHTSGAFGFLFDSLGAFDKPFNQAPSLHVALTVVLAALYLRHLPRWAKPPYLAWSALVVASTLTTFQHHFIDLPTGALLGFAVVWAWPLSGGSRFAESRLTASPERRRLALRYALASAVFAAAAIALGGAGLWLFWPAVSLAIVALAYLWIGPAAFAKDASGCIAASAQVLLAPYLIAVYLNSRLWTRGGPAAVAVADGVYVGRFPSRTKLAAFAAVIDLTAEFTRPAARVVWRAFPSLDLAAVAPQTLAAAAEAIERQRRQGPTLVCCALGYGRSVAATALWLVRSGRAPSFEDALATLKHVRPKLWLTAEQRQALEAALHV